MNLFANELALCAMQHLWKFMEFKIQTEIPEMRGISLQNLWFSCNLLQDFDEGNFGKIHDVRMLEILHTQDAHTHPSACHFVMQLKCSDLN